MPSRTGDSDLTINPDDQQFTVSAEDEGTCSHDPARQVSLAVVLVPPEKKTVVGAYSDPRTAMDAARRMAPGWADPRVLTQNLHHTKHPFPIA